MADDNESLRLSVDYDGGAGVSQFTNALRPLPGEVEGIFSRLNQAQPNTGVWRARGQDIARAVYEGHQAQMAGYSFGNPESMARQALQKAGLSPQQIRGNMDLLREVSRVTKELGDGSTGGIGKNFSKYTILGLDETKAKAADVERGLRRLDAEATKAQRGLDRLQGFKGVGPDGRPDFALSQGSSQVGYAWSPQAVHMANQLSTELPDLPLKKGVPNDPAASRILADAYNEQIAAQHKLVAAAQEQLRLFHQAPLTNPNIREVQQALQPTPERVERQAKAAAQETERVRQSNARVAAFERRDMDAVLMSGGQADAKSFIRPTDLQRQIAELRAQGVSGRGIREGSADREAIPEATRSVVKAVDAQYSGLIESIRAETAARMANIAAMRQGRAERTEALTGPIRQRSQFDERIQPTAPNLESDRFFRELQNTRRGGRGFGANGTTESFERLMDGRYGSDGTRAGLLESDFAAWRKRQQQGTLVNAGARQRSEYQQVWDNIPLTATELSDRELSAARNARVRANIAESQSLRDVTNSSERRRSLLNTQYETLPDGSRRRVATGSVNQNYNPRLNLGPAETPVQAALNQAQRRAQLTEAFGGQYGFAQQFRAGFRGPAEAPAGEMVGQTARIALFYGAAYRALNFLQEGIANVTQGTLDYEGALTDLAIALNRTRLESADLASGLATTAAAAGYSAAEGAQVGARAIGLYGVAQASTEEQDRTARISTTVATQVARSSGATDPVAVQTQLAGAARSFGYGVDRLTEIQDAITYISRNTGQGATELLGATSNIATLGRSSGFTPEQLMAIVAQVGTTTGQNPEATAGQFRQVLSREFSSVATRAQDVFGLDTSGMSTVAEVIDAVSRTTRTQEQTNTFSSIFGKGGSQTVAMITLENWDRIQGLSAGASANPGIGEETFNQTMKDIGQQLRVFASEAANLGVKLVETGLLDWLILVVAAGKGVVEVVTTIVTAFNEIPRPLRSVALAIAEIAIAAKLLSGSAFLNNARAGTGGRVATGLLASGALASRAGAAAFPTFINAGRSAAAGMSAAAAAAAAAAGPALTRSRGIASGAVGAVRANPVAAVGALLGVGIAVDQTVRVFKRLNESGDLLAEAQAKSAQAVTEAQFLDAAAQARAAREQVEGGMLGNLGVGDVANLLPSALSSIFNGDEVAALRALEQRNTQSATAAAERQADAERSRPSSIFDDFSQTGLEATMATLTERGFTAREQLSLLNEALFTFSDAAVASGQEGVRSVIARAQFNTAAGDVSAGVARAFGIVGEGQQLQADGIMARQGIGSFFSGDDVESRAYRKRAEIVLEDGRADEVGGVVRDSVLAQLDGMGTGDLAMLKDADIAKIKETANAAAKDSFSAEEWAALGEEVQGELTLWINKSITDGLGAFGGELTRENVGAYLAMLPDIAKNVGGLTERETGSASAGAAAEMAELQAGIAKAKATGVKDGFSDDVLRTLRNLDTDIAVVKRTIVSARIADMKRLTEYQTSFLADGDITGRIAVESDGIAAQLEVARKAYDESFKRDYSVPYPSFTKDAALGQTVKDLEMEASAKAKEAQANQLAVAQARNTASADPSSSIGMAAMQVRGAGLALTAAIPGEAEWWSAQASLKSSRLALTQAQVQAANGNTLASVDPRNTTGRIAAQIANARREMSILPAGERGALRDQINGLNQQMEEAVVSQANAAASASIAGRTGGLEQARVAIDNASRSLSIQLPGTEAYYSALSGLREAQAQLAEQERAQADRVRRLGSDLTDPVAQARLDTQAALETYWANAQAGEGGDVLGQNQVDIRGAQNREEAAMFSQRLSDTQIAEDLGRISHSQYMSYLQSEHNRLAAVGQRTRQQQDQLNQIDQLMKSAAEEMQGQFNIGDIDLPTAYEMRRAVGAGAPTQVADYSNSNNVVNIDGADFARVVEYLENTLGTGAQVLRASTSRKV